MIAGTTLAAVVVLLITGTLVSATILYFYHRNQRKRYVQMYACTIIIFQYRLKSRNNDQTRCMYFHCSRILYHLLNVVADIPSKEDKFRSKFSRVEVSSSAIQMKEKLGEGDYDDNINAIKVLELGAFGQVYKGVLLKGDSSLQVAVKALKGLQVCFPHNFIALILHAAQGVCEM